MYSVKAPISISVKLLTVAILVQATSFKVIGLLETAKHVGVDWYLTEGVYVAGGKLLNKLEACHGPAAPLTLYSIAPPPLSVASIVIEPWFVGHVGWSTLVVTSIVGGGVKNAGSYKTNTFPSPPSPTEVFLYLILKP